MKKILISFLLCMSILKAESETELLNSVLLESAITASQKVSIQNYFKNVISKKEEKIKRLEDQILLSYGGKRIRELEIKANIKTQITTLRQEINSYQYAININK